MKGKKFFLTVFSILVASLFFVKVVPSFTQERISCYCEKVPATLLVYGEAFKKAEGKIEYCRRSGPEFKIALYLEGLPRNHAYMLCLNGWPGRPGNEELKEYGRQGEGKNQEGYYNFKEVPTDEHGKINEVVSVKLKPAEYQVKFLVKDIAADYKVVLNNDNLKFMIEEIKISIDPDSTEVGHTAIVEGKVSDPNLNIYVFVHPLLEDRWWCQIHPSPPSPDGSWRMLCYFGTKDKGVGEYFEVVAVAACRDDLWKRGEIIRHGNMHRILKQYPHSTIPCYERTE